ncbi:Protein of uncharacterised function (DUF3815) [Listeria grayi]|uniref:Protein of uncharacterized function (DUF3815) n=1 Tax=Listeria grayi TaxID=1641 RepID=A0A378MG87_LISGR|nr:Protein of uncharacterised function (DUF3815) [Listeria grayi]
MFATILIHIICSYLATVAFAIITNVPRKTLNACGWTGATGWMAFWLFQNFHLGVGAASMAGAFVVAVCSHFFAKYKKCRSRFLIFPALSRLFPVDSLIKLCVILCLAIISKRSVLRFKLVSWQALSQQASCYPKYSTIVSAAFGKIKNKSKKHTLSSACQRLDQRVFYVSVWKC